MCYIVDMALQPTHSNPTTFTAQRGAVTFWKVADKAICEGRKQRMERRALSGRNAMT